MFYFLLLAFWINVTHAAAAAGGGSCGACGTLAIGGSGQNQAYSRCSGMGCRVYYHQLPKTDGVAYEPKKTKSVHWKHRFASAENEEPKMPNLDQTKWEGIIDEKWPGVLDLAARPAWDLVSEPWNAAMSLEALEKIWETIQAIVSGGLSEGDTGYKNPFNPEVAGGPTKEKTAAEINMHDINQMLVSPMTRGLSVPFATVARHVKATYSGGITTFVSHDWSEPFTNFLTTVQKHCQETSCTKATTYYWVCTFANNQWDFNAGNAADGYDFSSPFGKALNQGTSPDYQIRTGLKSALFIQSDVPQFLNIDRIWCVFELNLLINLKLPIFWGCQDKVVKWAVGAKNTCGASKTKLDAWTVDGAGVTVQADKDMIIEYVQGPKSVKTLVNAQAGDGKGSLKEFVTAFNSEAGLATCAYLDGAAAHTVETNQESSLSNNLLKREIEPEARVKESVMQIQSSWVTFLGGMFAGMSLLIVIRFAQSGVNEKLEQQYSVLLDSQNEC